MINFAILRNELRILRRDQPIFLVLVLMPLVLSVFFKPVFRQALQAEGYRGASGAEQAVPGMAVAFAFFIVGNVGFVFFREHAWGTWERLRASSARTIDVVIGKVVPLLLVVLVQQGVLFGFGRLTLGLHIRGSILALTLVAAAYASFVVSFGLAVTAIFTRIEQVNLVQTVGTLVFGGLGGALTPFVLLPGWAQAVGRVTPSYWAVYGYKRVILNAGGMSSVVEPLAVLMGSTLIFVMVALRFFRVEETKQSWA